MPLGKRMFDFSTSRLYENELVKKLQHYKIKVFQEFTKTQMIWVKAIYCAAIQKSPSIFKTKSVYFLCSKCLKDLIKPSGYQQLNASKFMPLGKYARFGDLKAVWKLSRIQSTFVAHTSSDKEIEDLNESVFLQFSWFLKEYFQKCSNTSICFTVSVKPNHF